MRVCQKVGVRAYENQKSKERKTDMQNELILGGEMCFLRCSTDGENEKS